MFPYTTGSCSYSNFSNKRKRETVYELNMCAKLNPLTVLPFVKTYFQGISHGGSEEQKSMNSFFPSAFPVQYHEIVGDFRNSAGHSGFPAVRGSNQSLEIRIIKEILRI
jgi:hypothetical protein